MAKTPSTMCALGTIAPNFNLPNYNALVDVATIALNDYRHKPLLVMFICNHCPYVVLIQGKLSELADKWQQAGLAVIAINSNDIVHYPQDAPDKMASFAQENEFRFPYLYDETQTVAKAYRAACTPDFFLFDADHTLVYRGQFDEARPGNGVAVTGSDLDNAIQHLLDKTPIDTNQSPSIGCNIKWKPGQAPEYF